jgi:hypothetical protein
MHVCNRMGPSTKQEKEELVSKMIGWKTERFQGMVE